MYTLAGTLILRRMWEAFPVLARRLSPSLSASLFVLAPAALLAGRASGQVRESSSGRTPAEASWRFDVAARAELGYDTNVFQTDSATGDAFTRLGGSASVKREGGRDRVSGRFGAARKLYSRFSRADELEGLLDVSASRDLGDVVAGLAGSASYLDLRLLDREGNLLPRTTFGSFSNRVLTFADVRLGKNLYLGAQAAYRLKDYEETAGLPSLDYGEWSAEAGLTRYLPGRSSIRLQGSWEERVYDERLAADAEGLLEPGNPELRLRRLEGEARLRKRWGEDGFLQAQVALRESADLFRGELTYLQRSGSLAARHSLSSWLVAVNAALIDRDFELRRSGGQDPLEEEFLRLEAHVERPLWQGARVSGTSSLSRRSGNDPLGDYTVGTFQLGLIHAF